MAEEPAGIAPMLSPPNRTLSEHIADQLRQAILARQLEPGQRIVEGQIAAAMATSRGPVRDALLLLENEGIVVRHAHRGTFVARLTLEDAEEIYTLRHAIESVALEYLVKYATPEQLDELDAHVQRMADLARQEYEPWEVTEMDLDFHRHLCQLSGHGRALEAWQSLTAQTRVLLLGHLMRYPREFAEPGLDNHRRLVAALRRRDAALAQEELRKHLHATLRGLLGNPDEATL